MAIYVYDCFVSDEIRHPVPCQQSFLRIKHSIQTPLTATVSIDIIIIAIRHRWIISLISIPVNSHVR
jgi:hypothetical protein